jgi:integrase
MVVAETKSFSSSFSGKRNRALPLTMIDSGLRLGEMLNLKLDDANLNHEILVGFPSIVDATDQSAKV